MDRNKYDTVIVTGPTASGKTGFASLLAYRLGGEVISADSRQVYRGMDLGTGKDYADYRIGGRIIPFHLVDIVDAGYRYNVFEYQKDFFSVYGDIRGRGSYPVVCGGSGMYIDSIVSGYRLISVPVNQQLRSELEKESLEELTRRLSLYKKLHNTTDVDTKKRAVRAIEIEEYYLSNDDDGPTIPELSYLMVGIQFDRDTRRERITERLRSRLREGMVEEVENLLSSGISPEDLIYYGLEYKYITLFLLNRITWEEMFRQLETAIHQFAKRQMTWFRGMERKGIVIHWLDGRDDPEEKLEKVFALMKK